jgi:uncharacterized integral membrane protein
MRTRDIKLVGALALVVVVALFVLQNAEPVRVAFLGWSWSASRALVLLTVLVIGAAAGWLTRGAVHRRRR